MELFDTHCHLADRAFRADLDEALARARLAGVAGMVCVGYDLASSRAAAELAGREERVWAAVGIHPHDAARAGRGWVAELRKLARRDKVVAIGETGLDFYRDLSPRPAQKDVFRRHLELALELGLPVIVHDRDAHDETVEILREAHAGQSGGATPPGVMHCFSGGPDHAQACLGLGFCLSFAGPLTYPKSDKVREIAAAAPADRLLVETDAPYLAPQAQRGHRNEPAFVAEVAAALAAVRGVSPKEAAALTTANARRLFGLG